MSIKGGNPGSERAACREVRPRAPGLRPPTPRASSPSPAVEAAPPRLGLAFILNDSALPWDAESPHSDATATPSRPALLPRRRETQWGSPSSLLDLVTSRVGDERPAPPLASPVWRVEAKSADAAWGVASSDTKREPLLSDWKRADWDGARKGDKDEQNEEEEEEEEEEKVDALPAPRASVATTSTMSREEKRRGRTCRVDGCDNYIVHKGLCCRHGGARKCTTEGCTSTAKYMGLCWKHGGSTWCKVEGCTKRAKAKGRCWAHGGGTQCGHDGCAKVAVSNGLCWAHGGGKRCLFDGCNRPGYERTNRFCDRHHDEVKDVNYFEV